MIVQEIPAVPVASSLVRTVQPADVEQDLDVPVLHTVDDDFGISSDAHLEHLMFQFRVRQWHSLQRRTADEVVDVPGQVMVDDPSIFDEEPVEVPLDSVSGTFVQQVVQHRVLFAPSSGSRSMEQVEDVPVPQRLQVPRCCFSASLWNMVDVPVPQRAEVRSRTRSTKYWIGSCFAGCSAGAFSKGFFARFPGRKKCDDSARVDSGTGPALQLMDASGL